VFLSAGIYVLRSLFYYFVLHVFVRSLFRYVFLYVFISVCRVIVRSCSFFLYVIYIYIYIYILVCFVRSSLLYLFR